MSAAPGAPAVELDGVGITFSFKRAPSFKAVAPVSFCVSENEFVSIVGPTGCGKSTLLNAVAGLLPPTAGQVRVFGAPLSGINAKAGYLFQQDAVMPWKTSLENVAVAMEVAGSPPDQAESSAADWLKKVGLAKFGGRYPHQMSGGQRKRVGLAQVLCRDPAILLMDEPFGPLDAQTRQVMGTLLLDLWAADRKTVLFVTHDLEEAISLSDRVLIMSAGPEARMIGDHKIDLPRPRDASDIRLDPRFNEIYRAIWAQLKAEVLKTYGESAA